MVGYTVMNIYMRIKDFADIEEAPKYWGLFSDHHAETRHNTTYLPPHLCSTSLKIKGEWQIWKHVAFEVRHTCITIAANKDGGDVEESPCYNIGAFPPGTFRDDTIYEYAGYFIMDVLVCQTGLNKFVC